MKQKICSDKTIIIGIMSIAVLSRVIAIRTFPGGVHADEAFSGYEAWSLLNYGVDSWGYHNPVYLTVWGGGMSVLNSYLMLPFIKLFGLNTLTVRIPQMLLGILSVYVLYCLLMRTYSTKTALLGSFLLAVSPWHIMVSRYGMDANLAPAFVLLGIYFLVVGLEQSRYFVISAMFWGLGLYAYAAVWIFVPVFLAVSIVYCVYVRSIKLSLQTVLSAVVLLAMALPLLIFVAVNLGIVPEIKSAVISVPKLIEFRGDELELRDLPSNLILALKIFIKQYDYNIWNTIPYFGLYYLFSTPFVIIGAAVSAKNAVRALKRREFSFDVLLMIWIIIAFASAVLQRTNFNRINAVLPAMFILLANGLIWCCDKAKHNVYYIIIFVYILCFGFFEGYYFTVYQDIISERQLAGADKALESAMEKSRLHNGSKIYITAQLRHSQVLFYTEYPTLDYIDEVKWKNYPDKYLEAYSFGNFLWDTGESFDNSGIYVILRSELEEYEQRGYDIEIFDYCAVAYMN